MSFAARLLSSRSGRAGLVLTGLVAALALAAPLIAPHDPLALAGPALTAPFADRALPLGTDRLGRDVLAGLVHGARASLAVGLAAAAMALVAGTIVGTVAGYLGGLVDEALMRLADAFQVVPRFLMALAVVSAAGASTETLIVAIAIGAWTEPARLARAEVLSIRERDYVAAARVVGLHPLTIAFREVLPGALPPVTAIAALIVAAAILIEAALSFLGFGDPNVVSWGSMIAEGRNVLRAAPYLSIVPGLALVVTVLGVYLLGEGVAEALAPAPRGEP
jgi:peptide/nickel transport system permease protein